MPFDERLRIAVDQAFQADVAARVKSLEKRARLRYPQADMRTLDLVEERGIDEWLLDKPDGDTLAFLLELTELRYGESPTLFATQYKREDWHERLGGGVHADANSPQRRLPGHRRLQHARAHAPEAVGLGLARPGQSGAGHRLRPVPPAATDGAETGLRRCRNRISSGANRYEYSVPTSWL